ncbi:conserved Plasmodium protein, unknown function [Plasmodium sp. DRC-Itaito]|nr:conserved Plasmodium protein, unknown function [Plasmodium sp. DRC-Itaito]
MGKCDIFIILPIFFFVFIWYVDYVVGQPSQAPNVRDLIKRFENSNESVNSNDNIINTSNQLERNINYDPNNLYNIRQNKKYENTAGRSYVSRNPNTFSSDNMINRRNTHDEQYMRDKGNENNRRSSLPNNSRISTKYYGSDQEIIQNKPVNNLYLGKSLDDFYNNLGVTSNDFEEEEQINYNENDAFSSFSYNNQNDGSSVLYDEFEYVDSNNYAENGGNNNSSSNSNNNNNNIGNNRNITYNENDVSYNDSNNAYSTLSNMHRNNKIIPNSSSLYGNKIFNNYSNSAFNNLPNNYNREHEMITPFNNNPNIYVPSEYSNPLDAYVHANNPQFSTQSYGNNMDEMNKLRRKSNLAPRDIYTVNNSLDERSINNNTPLDNMNATPSYTTEGNKNISKNINKNIKTNKSKKTSGSNLFSKNKKNDNASTNELNRYKDASKKIFNDNMYNKYENKNYPKSVYMFNEYQNNFFFNKILKSPSSNSIKKIFQKNTQNKNMSNIVSVTKDLQVATQDCIIKNKNKLTKPVILKYIALNNKKYLNKYEYAMSYIHFTCNSTNNKKSNMCLDIKPMLYIENDKNISDMINRLPNIYILNTIEYILTDPKTSSSYKSLIKNNIKNHHLTVTDIILLLSNNYFKNINSILVNHYIRFVNTKNETYLLKYYLSALISFVPFIKPAMKIYYDHTYLKLSLYTLNLEIAKVFNELLSVILKWSQAFKNENTHITNQIVIKMYKKLSSFSHNRNTNLGHMFRSLEVILRYQRMFNDIKKGKEDEYEVMISYFTKYMRNVYAKTITS